MRMEFNLIMDRDIDLSKYYIVPGEYEFTFPNGEFILFDFHNCDKWVSAVSPRELRCYVSNIESCKFEFTDEEVDTKLEQLFEIYPTEEVKITEFFVFTGEKGEDPEINPIAVSGLTVSFCNEKDYKEYKFKYFNIKDVG